MRTFFLHVEENSPLLRAHPAVKVLALFTVNLLAWVIEAPVPLLLLLVALLVLYKVSRVPLARISRFFIFILLIVQAVVVSYSLGSRIPGNVVYAEFPWGSYVTDMTLLYMATMILRFVCMLVGSTLILAVMRDVDIVYGMLSFKVPYMFAFIFNLALRFSSLFLDDFAMIKDAMTLRGARLDKGGILERARNYSRMGIPLTVIALRRMNELSYVLEIKGLSQATKRTYLYEFSWKTTTVLAAIMMIAVLAFSIAMRFTIGVFSFPGWPLR